MQFFQETSARAVATFVHQHIDDTQVAPFLIQTIKEYAGYDDVGEILNHMLLGLEKEMGDRSFENKCTPSDWLFAGKMRGLTFYASVYPMFRPANTPRLDADWVSIMTRTNSDVLEVCKTTVGEWNHDTRRQAIIKVLMTNWTNQRCKYCDIMLLPADELCCYCRTVLGDEECHFCQGVCGKMKFGRLKRGREPEVHYHEGCKQRKLQR